MRWNLGRLASIGRAGALSGLALTGTATALHAETINCTDVATLAPAPPYAILSEGVYCLQSDVTYSATSGAAIVIDSNNVVLDLNGHKIGGGPAGPATLAAGVLVNNHGNVIVKNGLVRGFFAGVVYAPGVNNNGNVVENVMAIANTAFGIYMGGPGTNNTVRRCEVGTTGGSTAATGFTAGIYNASSRSFVTDCTVNNTFVAAGGTGRFGIFINDDGRAVGNQVIGDGGSSGTNLGLHMVSGVYKDNIVTRCTTPYSGGLPVGATNYP